MSRHRLLPIIGIAVGVLLALAALGACGAHGAAVRGTGEQAAGGRLVAAPGTQPKADPKPAPPVAPLTGLVAKGGTALLIKRPALAVKIDNDPHARPQIGLNQADLVYEEQVEGITRFVAVFHSADALTVGPIRSARSSDLDILSNLNRPLFAWSGANATVIGQVNGAAARGLLVNANQDTFPDLYARDHTRYAPHNLYSATPGLRKRAPAGSKPPAPVFKYRTAGQPLAAGARHASSVSIAFAGDGRITGLQWVWSPAKHGWARFQTDQLHQGAAAAHVDANGVQIVPQNVVVMFVQYTESAARGSPQALTVGSGQVLVLTNGHVIDGRWSRPSPSSPIDLRTAKGQPIRLTPGRTWVELPRPGAATVQ
jgi:hypothetical protein